MAAVQKVLAWVRKSRRQPHVTRHAELENIQSRAENRHRRDTFSATSSSLVRSDDLTTVFVGHGTGDKKYPNKDINKTFDRFDYVFLTGEKQREKMIDSGIDIDERKLIKIGNMRFDGIVNRQYDRQQLLEDRKIAEASRNRKIVLYAPTWKWGNGTLEKYALKFARELSGEYFFIIRPHAHDRMMIGKLKREIRKENLRNVYISNPSDIVHHDTMTDFELADLLISDVSSIIYDFLITKKPIITIDNEFSDTHGMPKFMDITSISTIYRDADQIQQTVRDALEGFDVMRSEYEKMLADVFYFNDGKSVKRAAEFLKSNSAGS